MTITAALQGPLPIQKQSGVAAGGGTFAATIATNLAPFTNRVFRLRFTVFLSEASGGVEANAAALVAEGVYVNKGGTVTALTALAGSTNPINSNTAGGLAARPEATDAAMNLATAVLTIVGNNVTCTVTNNAGAGSVIADIAVMPYVEMIGST